MASPAVISVSKINASDIQFAEPKRNKQGGVSVAFKYNNQNVQFRFPQLSFPGGCRVKENVNKDGSTSVSYSMSATLQGCDPYAQEPSMNSDDISKTYNFLRELQDRVIQAAVENSGKWFGKKRGEEGVRESFNKFLSVSVDKTPDGWVPNGKYPPSVSFKLPVYDGKVCMDVIDVDDNDVEVNTSNLVDVFSKGCSSKLVVQASIYVVGQSFGVTWKPTYVQVSKRKKQTAREMFAEDNDDEEVAEPVEGGAKAALHEEEEEETPMPTTPPTSVVTSSEPPKAPRRRKVA